jgi:uroporphyrinogen-III decarboxylase
MTSLDRITAAFEGKPVDRAPIFHAGWSSWAASIVLGREAFVGGGIQQWREACALFDGDDAHAEFLERSLDDALAVSIASGQDMLRAEYWRYPVKPAQRIDEHTFLYGDPAGAFEVRRFDPPTELYQVIDQSPRPRPTLDDLEAQVKAASEAIDHYHPSPDMYPDFVKAHARYGREYAIAGGGVGLGIPYTEEWLIAAVERPWIVERNLDLVAEQACRNAEVMARIGLRFLRGGGDFCGNLGPIYSPRIFRQLMVPRLAKISTACHRHHCFHLFASDGDLWPVADDLFRLTGIDGYYEVDRGAGMDLRRLRERYPNLTLLGGIDSRTVHRGTPDDVRREVRDALEAASECGRIIVGISNYPVPGSPPANIEAMLETLRLSR